MVSEAHLQYSNLLSCEKMISPDTTWTNVNNLHNKSVT